MKRTSLIAAAVRRPLGRLRRQIRARDSRTRRQHDSFINASNLSEHDAALVRSISTRISANDTMYTGDGAHYFSVGLSAIHCIEAAMESASVPEPDSVLDLPCGHGRVLRFLLERFPHAAVTACDLDTDGVNFCVLEFGSNAIYSSPNLDKLDLGRSFDLIWCGSLVTHLDRTRIESLFRLFARSLNAGGLLVFSAHGDFVADRMLASDFDYMLSATQIQEIRRRYAATGFGYAEYLHLHGYGVSLTAPEWIRKRINELESLSEAYFEKKAWDNHHDVYGFVKS